MKEGYCVGKRLGRVWIYRVKKSEFFDVLSLPSIIENPNMGIVGRQQFLTPLDDGCSFLGYWRNKQKKEKEKERKRENMKVGA